MRQARIYRGHLHSSLLLDLCPSSLFRRLLCCLLCALLDLDFSSVYNDVRCGAELIFVIPIAWHLLQITYRCPDQRQHQLHLLCDCCGFDGACQASLYRFGLFRGHLALKVT